MDALGPLLHVLHRAKKGKCTAKDLVAPLETAIGNAAVHLSVERRRGVMKHLNSDLKSLAEGEWSFSFVQNPGKWTRRRLSDYGMCNVEKYEGKRKSEGYGEREKERGREMCKVISCV